MATPARQLFTQVGIGYGNVAHWNLAEPPYAWQMSRLTQETVDELKARIAIRFSNIPKEQMVLKLNNGEELGNELSHLPDSSWIYVSRQSNAVSQ